MNDNKNDLAALLARSVSSLVGNSASSLTSKDLYHLPVVDGPAKATQAKESKMKSKILRTLIFLRLVNGDDNLSLSNLAVIAILVKLCLQPSLDLASAATLLTVIGNYSFKRYINSKE